MCRATLHAQVAEDQDAKIGDRALSRAPIPYSVRPAIKHRLSAMIDADIVVSSTGSSQTILSVDQIERVMSARRHRPLFIIDIAVPRDIDAEVQHLENVYLYNIDHLSALVRENVRLREQELSRCHQIITTRAKEVMARFGPRPAGVGMFAASADSGFGLFQPAACGG